ncbi:MAG: SecDF P1 head subdomain-containing protein [Rhodanobacter sp.]
MRLIFKLFTGTLAAVLLSGWCFAAQPALGCKLSIYAMGSDQFSLGKQIVGSDQVISASYGKSNIIDGGTVLRVHLNASGALANRTFSANNIGRKIAILCDSKELVRAVIASQSGATFVIEGGKRP